MTDEIKARFMEKVDKCENGCWLWTACKNKDGYGQFKMNDKRLGAHCASYELFKGERKGLCVCHKCDTPACVNPDHLWLGTVAENNRDRNEKGRQAHPKGEKNGSALLTEATVLSIKKAFKDDTVRIGRIERLREKFPLISLRSLKNIIYEETWKHIIV